MPSGIDFNPEDLKKAMCGLFELSNACPTLKINEINLSGRPKIEDKRIFYDGTSDELFMV